MGNYFSKEKLETLLLEKNLLDQEKFNQALSVQKEAGESLEDILLRLGYLSKDHLLEMLSTEYRVPALHLSLFHIDPQLLSLIPAKTALLYSLIPLARLPNALIVGISNPKDPQILDHVSRIVGLEVHPVLFDEKELRWALEEYYSGEDEAKKKKPLQETLDQILHSASGFDSLVPGALLTKKVTTHLVVDTIENEPVVKLTNAILLDGVKRFASDIFIEPEEKTMRVRYRVDGLLREGITSPIATHSGVVSRIKVMASLNIAEHRVPQDGRILMDVFGKEVDFRVSVIPTYFGEKVVLRVLDKSKVLLSLDELGFEPDTAEALKEAAFRPYGMIVICGPTGSGKSTTLYSLLKYIDSPEKNIVTVEDPVEYQIEGFNQVAVRPEVELTFAKALRAILRQDPNIIMVGEVRDAETADISVKAALTGHLVLCTLHATSAVGSITRLINMGIERFLVTSTLLFAGSQKLVRKICLHCRESYEASEELIHLLDINKEEVSGGKVLFFRGRGCDHCAKTGYAGRTVLLEGLSVNSDIKKLIIKGAQEYEIKAAAKSQSMKNLRQCGIIKILQGVTTAEEVIRVTMSEDNF